jgi:uncharacterized membrane-anchored protein YitT (DUF2179 family)
LSLKITAIAQAFGVSFTARFIKGTVTRVYFSKFEAASTSAVVKSDNPARPKYCDNNFNNVVGD